MPFGTPATANMSSATTRGAFNARALPGFASKADEYGSTHSATATRAEQDSDISVRHPRNTPAINIPHDCVRKTAVLNSKPVSPTCEMLLSNVTCHGIHPCRPRQGSSLQPNDNMTFMSLSSDGSTSASDSGRWRSMEVYDKNLVGGILDGKAQRNQGNQGMRDLWRPWGRTFP